MTPDKSTLGDNRYRCQDRGALLNKPRPEILLALATSGVHTGRPGQSVNRPNGQQETWLKVFGRGVHARFKRNATQLTLVSEGCHCEKRPNPLL